MNNTELNPTAVQICIKYYIMYDVIKYGYDKKSSVGKIIECI